MPCKHYHSALDIIEIKCPCCAQFFPCHLCHEEICGAPFAPWAEKDFDHLAIFCTLCQKKTSIRNYLQNPSMCPYCKATFNPKCRHHWLHYFTLA